MNASACARPLFFGADDAVVDAATVLLLLLLALLPQPAATTATATATSASATRKRRGERCPVAPMLSSWCLVMSPPVTGAAFHWTTPFQQPASSSCALARNGLSSHAAVRGARRP